MFAAGARTRQDAPSSRINEETIFAAARNTPAGASFKSLFMANAEHQRRAFSFAGPSRMRRTIAVVGFAAAIGLAAGSFTALPSGASRAADTKETTFLIP